MRAIWKGSIGFGLVNIPIKLFSATQSSSLDLDMLDRKDHAPIRFKRINEHSGKEVEWANIVKGYMIKDDYVILEDADFEDAAPEKNKMIDIENFVELKSVDPIYYENSYYIEPDKGGIKAYWMLYKALEKTGKAGLGRFVLRTSENLCLIRPMADVLSVQKIRFPEEIRSVGELNFEQADLGKKEMEMAMALIKEYTSPFDIKSFQNSYTAALMKIIKAKASGKRPSIRKIKVEATKTDDLTQQLIKSLSVKKKVS
ncbi:non-homologous end joining protein Ku [Solitalea canadensis]|uniref:Non-homologous end joining protein Ku n=1 Tax=Solitalea canadensis (strain ATCC 29591 / DSM 3403 / JCM 21819 / LMG 8368 / NBRC 15130 / NCIMB 12057 / USAM 9D) TaxID=929556 RepID=H8KQK2_SOLCM|nr:Ku protein [Solitalea canadensis]AFD06740.1 Ku protein [Solitalea canadensis DSM 3403]